MRERIGWWLMGDMDPVEPGTVGWLLLMVLVLGAASVALVMVGRLL